MSLIKDFFMLWLSVKVSTWFLSTSYKVYSDLSSFSTVINKRKQLARSVSIVAHHKFLRNLSMAISLMKYFVFIWQFRYSRFVPNRRAPLYMSLFTKEAHSTLKKIENLTPTLGSIFLQNVNCNKHVSVNKVTRSVLHNNNKKFFLYMKYFVNFSVSVKDFLEPT